jgi:hypothetical protein
MFILKLFLFYLFFQDTFAVYDDHYQKIDKYKWKYWGNYRGKKN